MKNCPQCGRDFDDKNFAYGEIRCVCGWSDTNQSRINESRAELSRAALLFTAAILILSTMGLSLYFNTLEGRINYLQIKHRLSLSNFSDTIRLAELCEFTKKVDCAVDSYLKAVRSNENYVDGLLEIARMKRELGRSEEALEFYLEYLENPRASLDRMVEVADTLKAIGRMEEAIKIYTDSLQDVEGMVNLTAAKGLVRLYISNGEKSKAVQAIRLFDQQTLSADKYFSQEIQTLKNM